MDATGPFRRLLPPAAGTEQRAAWLARSFGQTEFTALTPADLKALSSTLVSFDRPAGSRIHAAGAPSSQAYIVYRGEVELHVQRGRSSTLVGIQREGGVFGDVPLLCDMPFPYRATARTDVTLLVLERDGLLELLGAHPKIAMRWLTSVVRRLEHANRRIVSLTVGDVRSRLLGLLRDEVLDGTDATIRLTQAEMAALLGASRQAVNRAVAGLVAEGMLATEYGALTVLDTAGLLDQTGGVP